MAVADRAGLPIAVSLASASAREVRLVKQTLTALFVHEFPERLIGDKAYDSDPLDAEFGEQGIEVIAPHRRNGKRPVTQDGRPLRRYNRRWKIERLFAWLQNLRRALVRHERYPISYLGFVQLGCLTIVPRRCF
jgi:transposase